MVCAGVAVLVCGRGKGKGRGRGRGREHHAMSTMASVNRSLATTSGCILLVDHTLSRPCWSPRATTQLGTKSVAAVVVVAVVVVVAAVVVAVVALVALGFLDSMTLP
jgi:hypothetical protein